MPSLTLALSRRERELMVSSLSKCHSTLIYYPSPSGRGVGVRVALAHPALVPHRDVSMSRAQDAQARPAFVLHRDVRMS